MPPLINSNKTEYLQLFHDRANIFKGISTLEHQKNGVGVAKGKKG